MKIEDSDFKFEAFSGTGKGGQHRNRHQVCIRCVHVPTGIRANGTGSKSMKTNKENALSVCKARIIAHFHEDEERFRAGKERIRTYHAVGNRVTDNLSGFTDSYKNVVSGSNIGGMIEARKRAMILPLLSI